MSQEILDSIVSQAIKEIERRRDDAVASANYTIEDVKRKLATIKIASDRDVFVDAVALAVGEFDVTQVSVGSSPYFQIGGGCSGTLTFVKSSLDHVEVERRRCEWGEQKPGTWGPKLRAMLVLFDDRAPVGPKEGS